MRPKLGFLVRDLAPSHLAHEIITGARNSGVDVVVFCEQTRPPCLPPEFAILSTADVWGYDGTAVATSLSTATTLTNAVGPGKKIFFVWDLEWTRSPGEYSDFASAYRGPSLLMARPGHAKAVSEAWNRPVITASGLYAKEIIELTS